MLTIPGHKEIHIKTMLRFNPTLVRIAAIKKQTITNIFDDVWKKEPSDTAGGNIN
jgi:hypothetical protein